MLGNDDMGVQGIVVKVVVMKMVAVMRTHMLKTEVEVSVSP